MSDRTLFYLLFLLEQTVWIPIILCIVRFTVVKHKYVPLFIFLITRAILELSANLVAIYSKDPNNALPYNLLYLSEALLVTWQLYNLHAFRQKKGVYIFLQSLWILLWFTDIVFIGSIYESNISFHTAYSFILLFITTNLVGRLAISTKQNMYRNTAFWVCITFSIWFIYNVFYAFSIYVFFKVSPSSNIFARITTFIELSEMVLYLILAWAIYCIPPKRNLHIV